MRIFDFFRKKRTLSEEEQKWNRMWDMWTEGKVETPYSELMEYESQVNNGGHSQYFFNVANCDDLHAAVNNLLLVLPEPLCENLKRGYDAFSAQEDICDDVNDDLYEKCDDVFYENEQILLDVLREYASKLRL